MLKFENIEVGTRIRAYDFEPCKGRTDRYVEGVIVESGFVEEVGAKVHTIECDVDTGHPEEYTRVGGKVYVPMQVLICEYDNRVTVIEEEKCTNCGCTSWTSHPHREGEGLCADCGMLKSLSLSKADDAVEEDYAKRIIRSIEIDAVWDAVRQDMAATNEIRALNWNSDDKLRPDERQKIGDAVNRIRDWMRK